ncbi:hypothetical protein HA402_006586 [Bradysia odoriphaga]|nr:hypothetical protein HA402_006586 [Bradysia odoriphaga]
MKVLVLLFVALCCVAAINATSLDTKSIKKIDASIKQNVSTKQDKKNQIDSEGDEVEVENDCTCNETENEKDKKVKKEKKLNGSNGSDSDESGSNETKDKKVKREKEQKIKEKKRNGSDSNESKDKKGSRDNKKNQKKNNGGRKGDSSEEDRSDKKIRKDKNQGGKKPCVKPSQPICNTVCTFIAAPLCASPDGSEGEPKTFDNECLLDVYNCQNPNAKYKKTSDGACKPVCPQACTFDLRPVCAIPDGWCADPQTFSNPCLLSVYNCENPDNVYKFFHDGDCLTTPAPEPDCGLIDCPQEVSQFCAIPTGFCGQPQTFNNKCYLQVYNCFNPDEQYEYFHDGECLTTPAPEPECVETACPNDDNKICGLPNGFCGEPKTFANDCYMKVYNTINSEEQYEYFHDGECLTTPAPEPNCAAISCSNEGPAICGLPDGICGPPQTFTNGCNLEVYNCFNPEAKYKYFHDGECLTTPEPEPNCAAISCSNEGPAICGLPDGVCGPPQTFTNGCNLEVYNCFNPEAKYKYFHDGECIEQPKQCPTVCPYNYDPICAAGQSGNVQTFPNKCTLESQNCLNENDQYTVVRAGECDECADIKCNKIGQPICATNSEGALQSFGNPCMLQQHNCENSNDRFEYSYDGSCIEPVICTKEYVPVCATSPTLGSRTFSNKCERDAHISQNPADGYVADYDGECQPVCRLGCPRIYDPRCGINSNGEEKEFSNECEYEKYNCLNPNDQYSTAYEGRCNQCNVACIEIYDPVCTKDSEGNVKTWGNQCELDSYNCRYPNNQYTVAHAGECNQCNVVCPLNYDPVCANDSKGNGKTYPNQCALNSYNCLNPNDEYTVAHAECTVAYAGECNQCHVVCLANYDPVCAYDYNGNEKTYSNQCELDSYNCRYPFNKCSLSYEGECHECQFGCPDVYDPVCSVDAGGNEKTFSNQCDLDNYNCRYPYNRKTCCRIFRSEKLFFFLNLALTVSYAGECHNCLTMCLAIYKPVCAKDSTGTEQTYSNQCELDGYNCRYPYNPYTVQYQGECKKPCVDNCPADCNPVCASANELIKAADGECPVECRRLKCPKKESWICATSNDPNVKPSSFYNDCERVLHNCNNPKNKFYYSRDGQCDTGC